MTIPTKPKPGYMRPKDAAEYLSVTRSLIYTLMKSKKLRSYHLGRARLLKVSDLDALVESNLAE
jgi:excisionase family DNA binding protein